MKQIKISILSISYNTADYVRKSIDSLLHQTLKEIEIIAIDNGSSDNSLEIFQEYARKDPRVKCYDMEECLGVQRDLGGLVGNTDYSACINYGLHVAQGEYIYILDCDDWLELHGLEVLYQKAKADNLDMIAFHTEVEYENESMIKTYQNHSKHFHQSAAHEKVSTGQEFLAFCQEKGEYLCHIFLYMVKRTFLQDNRITMTYFGGDNLYSFQLYMWAKRVRLHKEKLHHYLMRQKSGTELIQGNSEYTFRKIQVTYTEMIHTFFYHKCTVEQNFYLYRVIQNMLTYSLQHLNQLDSQKASTALTSLLNYENMLFGKELLRENLYIPLTKEELLTKKGENICFFGAGLMAEAALDFFQQHDFPKPLGICDNNPNKQGRDFHHIPIMSLEEALKQFGKVHFLVTNIAYSFEIILQLQKDVPCQDIWYYNFISTE